MWPDLFKTRSESNSNRSKRTNIMQVRDISSSAEWEAMYSLRIPVLAAADPDGSHEVSCSLEASGVRKCAAVVLLLLHQPETSPLRVLTMQRMIPRPAPRLTADRLEKHIINALT